MKKNSLFSLVSAFSMSLVFVGCDAMDAITATNAIPGKLDATQEQIVQSNDGIATTNAAIHKQKLLLSLDDMFKEENTRYLMPPTGMLAGGETFATEATTEEFMKLAFVWLKEVEKQQPDDSARGSDGKFPGALVAELDHKKMVKLMALQVIAGLLPQEVPLNSKGRPTGATSVEEIIQTQIVQGGRYENTAYAVLMARALFIKDLLIDPLFEEKITNPGKLEELVSRASSLDMLSRLPFADKIALNVTGMLNPDDNFEMSLDFNAPRQVWERITAAVETQLPGRYQQSRRVTELKAVVSASLAHWRGLR